MIVSDFSGGGGVEFPSVPTAGTIIIYAKQTATSKTVGKSFTRVGVGWGFVAVKTGVYRVMFIASGNRPSMASFKLTINSADVNGGAMTGTSTFSLTVDIAASVGDVVELWWSCPEYESNTAYVYSFQVSVLAPDIQAAMNEIISPSI